MAGMVQLADPAGTHGNGRNAPKPAIRGIEMTARFDPTANLADLLLRLDP